MTSRRDLFKIAAGLGLTGIVPTVPERIAAHKVLNVPVDNRMVHDPAAFANEAQLTIGFHDDLTNDWLAAICPEAMADYAKVQARLERMFPHAGRKATPEENAFHNYNEAAFALSLAMYDAGIRHGAAYEHLRRSVVGEVAMCWPCRGVGLVYETGELCPSCGGTGTVVTGAQIGRWGGGD